MNEQISNMDRSTNIRSILNKLIGWGNDGFPIAGSSGSGALSIKTADGLIFQADLTVATATAYAAGDSLFTLKEIPNAIATGGNLSYLESVNLIDKEDKGALDIDLVFFDKSVTLQANADAWTLSDADAEAQEGPPVLIRANHYVDHGNCYVAGLDGQDGLYKPVSSQSSGSVFVAGILRSGTPTYTADDALAIKLKFKQQ